MSSSSRDKAPHITLKPSLKQDSTGKNLTIQCQIQASPKPEVNWLRENKPISNTNKTKMRIESNRGDYHTLYLDIFDLNVEDSGQYKVIAKNTLGEVSAVISLGLDDGNGSQNRTLDGIAPNFIEKPTIKSENGGKHLIFECKIESDPEPNIVWYKDNVEIKNEGRYLIYCDKLPNKTYFAALEIDNVTTKDAGKYTIQVKNKIGESNSNIVLNLENEQIDNTGKPFFNGKPVIRTLEDKILFECRLTSELAPNITWEYNKSSLTDSVKYRTRIMSHGSEHLIFLEINNASVRDSGQYVVKAKNAKGESMVTINLDVQTEVEERKTQSIIGLCPRLISPPKTTQTEQMLSIQIQIECSPMPHVVLTKDTKEIKQSDRLTIRIEQRTSTTYNIIFEIKQPQNTDAGVYKFLIENELGEFTLNINLHIEANKLQMKNDLVAPTLLEKPKITQDKEKNMLKMSCRFKAKPEPKVNWLRDKIELKESSKYKFSIKNEGNDVYLVELEINNFTANDGGHYKVQAKNDAGQSNVLIQLEVDSITEKKESKRTTSTVSNVPEIKLEDNYETEGPKRASKTTTTTATAAASSVGVSIITEDTSRKSSQVSIDSQQRLSRVSVTDERRISRQGNNSSLLAQLEKDRRPSTANKPKDEPESGQLPIIPKLKKVKRAEKEKDSFVKGLVDIDAKEEDGEITFTCEFCKPPSKLRWYKQNGRNKDEIFMSKKYHFQSNGCVESLTIKMLNPEDSGKYICKCNETETFAFLKVEPAQIKYEFTKPLPETFEAHRTRVAVLECFVNHDECTIKWFKNGIELKNEEKVLRLTKEKSGRIAAKIYSITKADNAKFTCRIEETGEETHCQVNVSEPEFKFVKRLQNKYECSESKEIELECEIEDVEAECQWYYDGNRITSSDVKTGKYQIVVQGLKRKLIIFNCNPEKDCGKYECRCGEASTDTELVVKASLRIVKNLVDIDALEEEDTELVIELNNPIKFKPIWFKNGKQILINDSQYSDRYSFVSDEYVHKLVIKKTMLKDAGAYEVKIDKFNDKANLTVRQCDKMPTIDLNKVPKKIRSKAGQNVLIEISYEAYPEPTIEWYKDYSLITETTSTRYVSQNTSKLIHFSIEKAKRSDCGLFEVKLKNLKGEIKVPIEIEIIDKPSAPVGPLNVSEVTAESVLLNWQVPQDNGGVPITGYIVEKMNLSKETWAVVERIDAHSTQYRVHKLTPHKEYLFRVRAVNSEGEGVNLETQSKTLAKNPYTEPDAPTNVSIEDWNNVKILILKWQEPLNDGGAPIEKYIIEKKEKGKDWQKACEIKAPANEASVANLTEGKYYEFRISAVNKGGSSAPSEATKPHLMKHRFLKPRIDQMSIRPVTVKAGQPIVLDFVFAAEPLPTATLSFNDNEIQLSSERLTSELTEKLFKLTISKSIRKDNGKYTLKLSNSSGSDSADWPVTVLSSPSSPKGPLLVKDVRKDRMTLEWNKPDDDGGRKIETYVIEKKTKNSDVWERVAVTSDTFFTVNNLKEGVEYEFRVSAENINGVGDALISEQSTLAKNPFDVPLAPREVSCVSRSLNHIEIGWKKPSFDGGAPILGYLIEKREVGSRKWTRMTRQLITEQTFIDSEVLSRKKYEYRVIAVNEEGLSEPSSASDEIPAKPEKEKPQIDKTLLPNEIRVRAGEALKLEIPIVGFPVSTVQVKKSDQVVGVKDEIASFTCTEETCLLLDIQNAQRGHTGSYNVRLDNSEGFDSLNLKIIVLDKPGKCSEPFELVESSKSSVTLKWNPPKDDGGAEVTGYIIEKKQEGSDLWERCATSASTKTTIRNLVEYGVYNFRVCAENIYGVGEFIETKSSIIVKPPFDPPGAPDQPRVIDSNYTFITITWNKPSFDGGDPIIGYLIEQKEQDSNQDWISSNRQPHKGTEFTATGLNENQFYEFRVRAVNEAGPGAYSKPSELKKAEPNVPSTVGQPKIDSVAKDSVKLSWNKPENDGGAKLTGYVIEKCNADGTWVEVGEANAQANSFTVTNVAEGEETQFRIRARNPVGLSEPSVPTDKIKIENPPEKPSFTLGHIKDIIVKASETFDITINYRGSPKPTCELSINDETFTGNNDRVTLDVHNECIKLLNTSAKRIDTGFYRFNIKNSLGFDSTSVRVTVLDVPGKPEGPLEVSNLTADSCTLKWHMPKDDGGNQIMSYVVEKREKGSTEWTKLLPESFETSYNVKDLEEGKEYEFRVLAKNVNGLSEGLVTESSIVARWPFNPPSAPGVPTCISHTEDSLHISWTRPKNDGGDAIAKYIVEIKEEGTDKWVSVIHANEKLTDTQFNIKGLQNGKKYHIRVAAVNRAGKSSWSTSDEAIEVRPADCAPKFSSYFTNREVTVIEGELLKLSIPYEGSPEPQVIWKLNNQEIKQDLRTKFLITQTNVELQTENTSLDKDAGVYSLTLKNKLGEDSILIKVNIVGRPQAPEGPMLINDINSDGCTIKFNIPKHDGGSPVTNYIIEKCDVLFNEWIRVSSFCRQLSYEFIDLEEKHSYKFRVYAVNQYGQSREPLESSSPVLIKSQLPVPNPPNNLRAKEIEHDKIEVEWNSVGGKILGYKIEIQKPNSNDWILVNDALTLDNCFTINGLQSGQQYNIRVRAKNASGWSEPSFLNVTTKIQLPLPNPPSKPSVLKVGKTYVDLTWQPSPDDDVSKLSGYVIEKKLVGSLEGWIRVNSYLITETITLITDLIENKSYEFRVRAVNKTGESEPSESTGSIKITEYPDGVVPEITKTLKDQEGPLGGQVEFHVEFKAKPDAEVVWSKNSVGLYSSGRYTINTTSTSSTLIIRDLWDTNHNNTITCLIQNPLGKIQSNATLRIKQAPKIDKEPNDQIIEVNDTLKVKIPIIGKGPFKYTVKLNDETTNGNKYKIEEYEGSFTFILNNIKREDEGKYTIYVSNDAGSTECSFKVKVKSVPNKPEGPLEAYSIRKTHCCLKWKAPLDDGGDRITHYIIEKKDTTLKEETFTSLYETFKDTHAHVRGLSENHEYVFRVKACNSIGASDALESQVYTIKLNFGPPEQPQIPDIQEVGSNYVTLLIKPNNTSDSSNIDGYYIERKEKSDDKWYRCNINLCLINTYTVSNLIEENEYEFRVIAENEAGQSVPSESTGLLRLVDPDGLPQFTSTRLKDIEVNEGKDAKFECEVSGYLPGKIKWFKNGTELYDSLKYTLTQTAFVYTLIVNNACIDDEGDYTIRVYNTSQTRSISQTASLAVRYAPKIRLPNRYLSTISYSKGENISLKIPFSASPKPNIIQWKINDIEINSNAEKYEIDCSTHYASILIKNINTSDSGVYRLKLENTFGSDSVEIPIQVLDVPSEPRELNYEQLSDESVKLTWKIPVSNGGCDINGYVLEKSDNNQTWSFYSRTHHTSMILQSLLVGQEYYFRILAENYQGRSLPSNSINFSIKPTPKRQESRSTKSNYQIPDDYDKYFHNLWSSPNNEPQSIMVKTSAISDDYDIYEELGRGPFGIVHRAIEKKTGKTYLARFVATPDNTSRNLIRREVDMMNQLIHPNLLNLHDYYDHGHESILITEFISGDDFLGRVSDKNYVMTEEEAKIYIRQLCRGLRHMHRNNIVHLAIKPETILFETKTSKSIKQIDFGLAARLDPDEDVKITTETLEYCAPEIVDGEQIGFYTDMWSVGILTYILLSGISPFSGQNDDETKSNIRKCDTTISFPSCFNEISDNGKDFIRKLLIKEKTSRMNVFEALDHPWLLNDTIDSNFRIPSSTYDNLRLRMRNRYPNWLQFYLPIARLSNYSSLRKLRKTQVTSYYFDRREAAPRFILKPRNQYVLEGQNAEFKSIVVASSEPLISWYRNDMHGLNEIKQSTKYMKKYSQENYSLEIKKCLLDDQGEYVLRASNSYGERECVVFLNVNQIKVQEPTRPTHRETSIERRQFKEINIWREEDIKPTFTFSLRNRLIQEGVGVKFLCTCVGRPQPKITWFKDKQQIDETDPRYSFSNEHGVCSFDISACYPKDAGNYMCRAENYLGSHETYCVLIVESSNLTTKTRTTYSEYSSTSTIASSSSTSSSSRHRLDSSLSRLDSSYQRRDSLTSFQPQRRISHINYSRSNSTAYNRSSSIIDRSSSSTRPDIPLPPSSTHK